MSVGDIFLLTAVCLWAAWAVFALVRRRVTGKGCCASCTTGCSHCSCGKHGLRPEKKKR